MPRAAQETPPKITHDPRVRLTSNLRQTLPNPIEIAKQSFQSLLRLVKDHAGLDFASPVALVASITDALAGVVGGIVSQIAAALTGGHAPGAGLADIAAWAKGLPVLGDIVEALTGKAGGTGDLEAWAQSLPSQAQHAAEQAISGVNQLVGQLAHDAEQVGESLAATIAGVLGVAHDAHAQTEQNTAAITALSTIAPTNAVTSLAASTDPNDIVCFDRVLMLPIAATVQAGDHNHTVGSGGGATSTAGAHTHAIAADAWAYTPADRELVLILIRSDRKQQVNAVKLDTAATGWSLGGISSALVSLHAYSQPDNALKLLANAGDQKNTITTAAQEFTIPLGQSFDVLPGHVLAIGVLQQINLLGATRKLAGVPQVGIKPRTGAPIKAMLGKLTGQTSVPATIPLANVAWNYNAAVWGALTLA